MNIKMFKENTPLLETRRLVLRKFTENDMEDMLLIYSDEEVNTFLPWFPMKTTDAIRDYLHQSILPEYEKETAYRYAIALKEDNRPIGYVNISDLGESNDRGLSNDPGHSNDPGLSNDLGHSNDLGYGLRKEFWHKSITTEACAAVINRLKEVNFPFLTATHDINNPHSGAVMKKLGMTYCYSYEELVQPKNNLVTFRMYQLNLDGTARTYTKYQEKYPSFVEQI